MSAANQMAVWMNGVRVGHWTRRRSQLDNFQYDESWLTQPTTRALSLSLPLTPGNMPHRGPTVTSYFDNLLPDSDRIRSRVTAKYAANSTGAFDLLAAIGRDCVGAVQLLPHGEEPVGIREIRAKPLKKREVERVIDATLSGTPLTDESSEDDFRISIAGAQEKTALLFHDRKWCLPLGSTPSTHILKMPLGLVGNMHVDLSDSVENEWLCLQLLKAFGLAVPDASITRFGRHQVLVVPRFDRRLQSDGWITRLPQEDFCQALGLPSSRKYEADGGPGMNTILRVLDTSSNATSDKKAFVKAQILFWALAATDGHAKNFSIFHERGGSYRLTPFYDVLSAWPIVGGGPGRLEKRKVRLAMAVRSKNAHWRISEIQTRHWDAVAKSAGLGDANQILTEVVAAGPTAIGTTEKLLAPNFPVSVADAILTGLAKSLRALAKG